MTKVPMGTLRKGESAEIAQVAENDLGLRMLEMGFVEGEVVTVMEEAPFGGDPLAIQVRGALVAVRRKDANQVLVVVVAKSGGVREP